MATDYDWFATYLAVYVDGREYGLFMERLRNAEDEEAANKETERFFVSVMEKDKNFQKISLDAQNARKKNMIEFTRKDVLSGKRLVVQSPLYPMQPIFNKKHKYSFVTSRYEFKPFTNPDGQTDLRPVYNNIKKAGGPKIEKIRITEKEISGGVGALEVLEKDIGSLTKKQKVLTERLEKIVPGTPRFLDLEQKKIGVDFELKRLQQVSLSAKKKLTEKEEQQKKVMLKNKNLRVFTSLKYTDVPLPKNFLNKADTSIDKLLNQARDNIRMGKYEKANKKKQQLAFIKELIQEYATREKREKEYIQETEAFNLWNKIDEGLPEIDKRFKSVKPFSIKASDLPKTLDEVKKEAKKKGIVPTFPLKKNNKGEYKPEIEERITFEGLLRPDLKGTERRDYGMKRTSQFISKDFIDDSIKKIITRLEYEERYSRWKHGYVRPLDRTDLDGAGKVTDKEFKADFMKRMEIDKATGTEKQVVIPIEEFRKVRREIRKESEIVLEARKESFKKLFS